MNISEFLFKTGILDRVIKPSRYIGGEYNSKNKKYSKNKIALCFPDVYEVGMSFTGYTILYDLFNSKKDLSAERVFLPWFDMISFMEKYNIHLYSLENYIPIKEFDILGITLQYELSYTNIIKILSLSDIPILSKERSDKDPIIIGGGPCAGNPEPIADFFDLFLLGDGEDFVDDLNNILNKENNRNERINMISKLEGVYNPNKYNTIISKNNFIIPDIKNIIKSRKVYDLNNFSIPENPIVPNIESVHNRAVIEIMRGCKRGCRFCQAGMIYRPVRERSLEKIKSSVLNIIKNTGYKEISFLSLSTLDYTLIKDLLKDIYPILKEKRISVSLPSSRIDKFSLDITEKLSSGRKASLTFAPEAGSQKLRNIINKNITEEEIISVLKLAKTKGWKKVKLYFMIGLPYETNEDIEELVKLVIKLKKITQIKDIKVNVSVFIPKSHTPFQFAKFNSYEEINEKRKILFKLKERNIQVKIHNYYESLIEAILARGDRNLSKVLIDVCFNNGIFQQSEDNFIYELWSNSFIKHNIDTKKYLNNLDNIDILPWQKLSYHISNSFFHKDWNDSKEQKPLVHCSNEKCVLCGVCSNKNYRNIFASD